MARAKQCAAALGHQKPNPDPKPDPKPKPKPKPKPNPKPKPHPKPKPNQVLLRLSPLIPFNALNYVLAGSAAWPECPVGALPWAAAQLGPSAQPVSPSLPRSCQRAMEHHERTAHAKSAPG